MSDWTFVANVSEIPPQHHKKVDLDGTLVAVFNIGGEFFAIEDVCTHDGAELTSIDTISGSEIVCPRHGARFCVKTGEALSAPAYEPTATFPVKVEGGKLFSRDDRWD